MILAVFSALPEAPYASQIVTVPDNAAALALAPPDAAALDPDGAAAVAAAGLWVAPLEQALINSNAAATSGAKRSFFMAIACLLLVASAGCRPAATVISAFLATGQAVYR